MVRLMQSLSISIFAMMRRRPVIDNDLRSTDRGTCCSLCLKESHPEKTESDLERYGDIQLGRQFVTQNVILASRAMRNR